MKKIVKSLRMGILSFAVLISCPVLSHATTIGVGVGGIGVGVTIGGGNPAGGGAAAPLDGSTWMLLIAGVAFVARMMMMARKRTAVAKTK